MKIIITGSSKGIGKAIAEEFAAEDHELFLCSRNEKRLAETQQQLQSQNKECIIHVKAVDLSIKSQVKLFADWCLTFGVPDILINNAGGFIGGNVYNETDGTLEKMIETNLYSAYYLTRMLLPSMMEAKRGYVFNICSIASLQAYKNGGAYSVSKFALMGFTKNLREEMKPFKIKVTGIYPGATLTDSWQDADPTRIMEAKDISKMIYAITRLSQQAVVEDIILRPQLGDL